MPDPAMTSAGKGARVLGFFIFQLGAGVILDSTADTLGAAIVACGLAMLAWGAAQIAGSNRGRAVAGDGPAGGSTTC
jgi:hypothetical protein